MHIVGGTHKRKRILCPSGEEVRPTSSRLREALFNICQGEIEGARFLDAFAGTGAVGLEALSRGAQKVTFIEQNAQSLKFLRKNVSALGFQERVEIFSGDTYKLFSRLAMEERRFHLVYLDPPYAQMQTNSFFSLLRDFSLLESGGRLFIESPKEAPSFEDSLQDLLFKDRRNVGNTSLHQYLNP